MLLIYLLFALVILTVPLGFIILIYRAFKIFGLQRIGTIIVTILGLGLAIFLLYIIFEDQLFFKRDARKLLSEQNLLLRDNFEIIENTSTSAIGDYYHTFTLKISSADKELLINEIRNSKEFKGLHEPIKQLLNTPERYDGRRTIQNYEDSLQYVREYFQSNGNGYAPTYRKIEIDKRRNLLIFEDIDD